MATSGQVDFTTTRNEIIRHAALHIGAIGAGVIMNDAMVNDFAHNLNGMVKRWHGKGIHVWTVTEATLFPQPGQIKYKLGTGTTDHCATTWYLTALSADEAVGQTVLSIDSNADMTDADKIGVVLDDGTLHWTTIVSSTSSTVTLTDALPDSASTDAKVFFYTSDISRPLKIVDARRYNIVDTTETPISMVSRSDYQAIPQKTATGAINQAFYDRQLANGFLHLWQVPATATELLKFTWHRPIEVFSAAGDNPDLPHEWVQTLEFNLALVMAAQFDVPEAKFRRIERMAAQYLDDLVGFDREDEAIFMQPDMGP